MADYIPSLESGMSSLNVNGQSQPSTVPDIEDSSLHDQILPHFSINIDDSLVCSKSATNDDISNALIDLDTTPLVDQSSFDGSFNDSISDENIHELLQTSRPGVSNYGDMEALIDGMTLNHLSHVGLHSFVSVQYGSSPVEQNDIHRLSDTEKYNVKSPASIVSSISDNCPKYTESKAVLASPSSSSEVAPIDIYSRNGSCQPCTATQDIVNYDTEFFEFDTLESKKIRITCEPRSKHRPMDQSNCNILSYYIRCEFNSEYEYPTIEIPSIWARESIQNIIEVTLVTKDKQPHPYKIDNKNKSGENSSIFRHHALNTLYFYVTEDDFRKGNKSFMIEYIKSEENEIITKDIIRTQELHQSMLRFTRYFQNESNNIQLDEESVSYSSIMTEVCDGVGVLHMGPKEGAFSGNELVYVLLKGQFAKTDILVYVRESTSEWCQPIPFTKKKHLICFSMPELPFESHNEVTAKITIFYKGHELYETYYIYKVSLEQSFSGLSLNNSCVVQNVPSNPTMDVFNFFASTGVCPVMQSSGKKSKATTKRLNNK